MHDVFLDRGWCKTVDDVVERVFEGALELVELVILAKDPLPSWDTSTDVARSMGEGSAPSSLHHLCDLVHRARILRKFTDSVEQYIRDGLHAAVPTEDEAGPGTNRRGPYVRGLGQFIAAEASDDVEQDAHGDVILGNAGAPRD